MQPSQPSNYGHADAINRRARLAIVTLLALVAGAAFGVAEFGGRTDPPPPSVLGLVADSDPQAAPEPTPPSRPSTTTAPVQTGPADPAVPARVEVTEAPADSTTLPPPPPPRRSSPTTTTPSPSTTLPPTTTTTSTTTTTLPPTTTTTTSTTTTTVPPTTTTTTVEVRTTMHIAALEGAQRGDDDAPTVRFEVRVRDQDNRNVRGAVVTAVISGMGDVTMTTNGRGWARLTTDVVTTDQVTITVTALNHPDYVYAPDANTAGPSLTIEIDD